MDQLLLATARCGFFRIGWNLERIPLNVGFKKGVIILVSKYLMNTYSKWIHNPNMKTGLALQARPTQTQETSREQTGNWIERDPSTTVSF